MFYLLFTSNAVCRFTKGYKTNVNVTHELCGATCTIHLETRVLYTQYPVCTMYSSFGNQSFIYPVSNQYNSFGNQCLYISSVQPVQFIWKPEFIYIQCPACTIHLETRVYIYPVSSQYKSFGNQSLYISSVCTIHLETRVYIYPVSSQYNSFGNQSLYISSACTIHCTLYSYYNVSVSQK